MKKIFGIILAVCLMATMLCVAVFAADAPASDVVLRISATKKDGSTVVVKDYTSFEDGWNAAMELAANPKELNKNEYARVIVDLYSDWNAVKGEFTKDFFNGVGFEWDAIYIPENVKVTLNLNGHTINRGLTEYQYNGEVMYIDEEADVIINDGTITGGYSCNGAGGIHVNDGANVTLNNVHVDGNRVEDDDGAAIALYDGATLTMNGGSMSNNIIRNTALKFSVSGRGVLSVQKNSNAILNNVTFSGNMQQNLNVHGLLIYVDYGTVTMDGCFVENNGLVDKDKDYMTPMSLIFGYNDTDITITNTEFKNNGSDEQTPRRSEESIVGVPSLITLYRSNQSQIFSLNVEKCNFTENATDVLFYIMGADFEISDCTATNNAANVLFVAADYADEICGIVRNCTFDNNSLGTSTDRVVSVSSGAKMKTIHFYAYKLKDLSSSKEKIDVTFENCEFGNATFANKSVATFTNGALAGSLIGEGSLTMIVSITALIASVTAIGITLASNKKKKDTPETDDEE